MIATLSGEYRHKVKTVDDLCDGGQSRSFADVADVVRATIALAEHRDAAGEAFNIGGGGEITINDLADRVKALTESRSEIVHIPFERAYEGGFEEPRRRVPDTTRLRTLLNFTPTIRGVSTS